MPSRKRSNDSGDTTQSNRTKRTPKKEKEATSAKPGSDVNAAKSIGGGGDFGVPVGDTVGREYTSMNTKRADPGAASAHSGDVDDGDSLRESGAGGDASGPGSSSGGDIDTDIIGVGTGGSGIAASGVTGRASGPDDSDGTANEFAGKIPQSKSAKIIPARGAPKDEIGRIGGPSRMNGSTVAPPDAADSFGADNVSNAAREDDSFAGEISSGEARGEDN